MKLIAYIIIYVNEPSFKFNDELIYEIYPCLNEKIQTLFNDYERKFFRIEFFELCGIDGCDYFYKSYNDGRKVFKTVPSVFIMQIIRSYQMYQ